RCSCWRSRYAARVARAAGLVDGRSGRCGVAFCAWCHTWSFPAWRLGWSVCCRSCGTTAAAVAGRDGDDGRARRLRCVPPRPPRRPPGFPQGVTGTSAGMATGDATSPSVRAPGIVLGVGLGGFVDGILLHQLLQWHHMLTGTDTDNVGIPSYDPTTV